MTKKSDKEMADSTGEKQSSEAKESLSDAEINFIESIDTVKKQAEEDHDNTTIWRDLSNKYLKAGDIYRKTCHYSEAFEAYNFSIDIRKKLDEFDPGNDDLQRSLSFAHERQGDLFSEQGLLDDAKKAFSSSLYIREKLANKDPDNPQKQRDLWVAYWRVSDIMEQQGSMDALVFWHATYNILCDMKKKGFNISPEDEQHFEYLKDIFGKCI
jgi:tetratricopeptide (TPR) repeat protein